MKNIIFILLFSTVLFSKPTTIEIRKSVDSLPSIAVENSSIKNKSNSKFGTYLLQDLKTLAIFNVERKIENIDYNDENVNIINKELNYILRYNLYIKNNKSVLDIKLISNKNILFSKQYIIGNKNQIIFLSHNAIYDINKFMGFDDVEWMKEKVILAKSNYKRKKNVQILVADYTLKYQYPVLKYGVNLFPKWADDKKEYFYYTKLVDGVPQLRKRGIYNKKDKLILKSDGMIVCSDVSKDFKDLLITMAPKGTTDIYKYNVKTKKLIQVTKYKGIDVNGQFLEDNKIVFVSDRLGYPNIFSKSINGSAVEQLVYNSRNNSACTSYKNNIIYKSRETSKRFERNTFNLQMISTETNNVRRLTVYGVNEYPIFSKDGNTLLFIKSYKGRSSLNILRLNKNKTFTFILNGGSIQSIDW